MRTSYADCIQLVRIISGPWPTCTPFGFPVVPDVYITYTRSEAPHASGAALSILCTNLPSRPRTAPIASLRRTSGGGGVTPSSSAGAVVSAAYDAVCTSASGARLSPKISTTRAAGKEGSMGRYAAPAKSTPKIATTISTERSKIRATSRASSERTLSEFSAPARAFARIRRFAYVTRSPLPAMESAVAFGVAIAAASNAPCTVASCGAARPGCAAAVMFAPITTECSSGRPIRGTSDSGRCGAPAGAGATSTQRARRSAQRLAVCGAMASASKASATAPARGT